MYFNDLFATKWIYVDTKKKKEKTQKPKHKMGMYDECASIIHFPFSLTSTIFSSFFIAKQ